MALSIRDNQNMSFSLNLLCPRLQRILTCSLALLTVGGITAAEEPPEIPVGPSPRVLGIWPWLASGCKRGLQITDPRGSISEWFFQAQWINSFSLHILRISREHIHISELLLNTIIVHLASNYSNRKIGNHCKSGLKELMAWTVKNSVCPALVVDMMGLRGYIGSGD